MEAYHHSAGKVVEPTALSNVETIVYDEEGVTSNNVGVALSQYIGVRREARDCEGFGAILMAVSPELDS